MLDQLRSTEPEVATSPTTVVSEGRRRTWAILAVAMVALLVGATAGWLTGSADESADEPSASMRRTVDAWVTAVEAQSTRDIAALYADDAIWYDEALDDRFTSQGGVQVAWGIFGTVDTATVDELAVTDDTAVLRWTLIGPAGLDLTGISVLEFDGDVIVAETVYYDSGQMPGGTG